MSDEFPSIWLEYQSDHKKKPTLISGFYRVWTQDGEKTTEGQLARIKVFNSQIEQAFEQKIKMNMMILVVSTVMFGPLFARFRIVDYVTYI